MRLHSRRRPKQRYLLYHVSPPILEGITTVFLKIVQFRLTPERKQKDLAYPRHAAFWQSCCTQLRPPPWRRCGAPRRPPRPQTVVVVLRVLDIAVGSLGAQVHPQLGAGGPGILPLAGDPPGIAVVHHVEDGDRDVVCVLGAVHVVAGGDETDVLLHKVFIQVHPGLVVVAPEAAQVFADHGVDPAAFDVLDHTLEARPLKVGPGLSIVNVVVHDVVAVPLTVIGKHGLWVWMLSLSAAVAVSSTESRQ